ncbi:helix-turn-helix domain-containing protein [Croceitalea rosinachiae]|uniref:Helix-turn-helix domain-containing protein n=1 Tax=Croceitalea rosinachiae TaxID=3075596 RepID=A0ABU3A9U3_9FLAO|nr:helix-turn-helix domain-containing protein [Croceitalea sp. F388]MDT0605716.1 helix-turn-helix domain-containing protein [Croceitalea sp. F388]
MKLLADFIIVSGFVVTIIILVMLTTSKKRELPKGILIVLLGLSAMILLTLYAHLHQIHALFAFTLLFEDGAGLLIGPLVFLYIESIFNQEENLILKRWLHFVPFITYWIVVSLPKTIAIYYGEEIFEYVGLFRNAYVALAKNIFVLIYIFFSIRLFLKYKELMKSNYSTFTNDNYGWLKKLLMAFLIVFLFDMVVITVYIIFKPSFEWDLGIISVMFLSFVIFYLGYHGLKQSIVHFPEFLIKSEEVKGNGKRQLQKLMLSSQELETIKDKLNARISEEKPYLQQELTLNDLADLVGISDKNLSLYLNHSLNTSFYDFVNKCRVEEVKEKLKQEEYKKYSLLGMAFASGFNSKSSFYRAFKKETGISPTEFKKKIPS